MALSNLSGMLLLLVCCTTAPLQAESGSSAQPSVPQAATSVQENDPCPWRYTRFGWEDSSRWQRSPVTRVEPVPGIHPLAWSAILCLSVLVLLLWASSEDELARWLPNLVQTAERKTTGAAVLARRSEAADVSTAANGAGEN